MAKPSMVILEQDHASFLSILDPLRDEANAKFVFLLDKTGQQIASSGRCDSVDPTALASLAAGNVAATEGLAQLIGEREFSTLFHEGEQDHLHISLVAGRIILLVIFDERSSLGLVRLRVRQRWNELTAVVQSILARGSDLSAPEASMNSPLADLTDEDIDQLFG